MSADIYSLFAKRQEPEVNGSPIAVVTDGSTTQYARAALEREAAAVTAAPEGARNNQLNRAAFNLSQLITAGHLPPQTVWDTLTEAARRSGLDDHEIESTLKSGYRGGTTKPRSNVPDPDEPPPAPPVTVVADLEPEVETDFWDTRPLLRHVHDFARSRRASPWAVLGVVLARIVTATPHQVCLPPIIGGKGSLNMFVGLVGPSGAGKGAASGAAADAVHIPDIKTARLASGEAIAHLYKRRLTKAEREAGETDWNDTSHARLVDVSEIDRFAAQSNRQGSTLMADLRAAWSGEMLGQVAADSTRSFLLEPHEYRLTMVAGIQPHRAGVLLEDEDGGTPQRFVWLPVTDPDAPPERPSAPQPISWSPPPTGAFVGVGGVQVDVDPAIVAEVDAARLATLRGEGDPLDGHRYQCQLKVAAALGVADQRYTMSTEDWQLAQTIMHKSAATRSGVVAAMKNRAAEEGVRKAEADATRAVIVEERTLDAAVKRVCTVIVKKLRRVGDWVSHSDLRRAITSHDRKHFEDALRRLYEAGQIEHSSDATRGGNGAYRLVGEDQ